MMSFHSQYSKKLAFSVGSKYLLPGMYGSSNINISAW